MRLTDQSSTKTIGVLVVLSVSVLTLAVIVIPGENLIKIAALAAIAFSMLVYRFGYLAKPYLFSGFKLVDRADGFELARTQDAAIKHSGNKYYATQVVVINYTSTPTDQTPDEVKAERENYAKLLASFNFPLKLSQFVLPKDLTQYAAELERQVSYAETELAKARNADASPGRDETIMKLVKKLDMLKSRMDDLAKNKLPTTMLSTAMTCASATNREDAISRVRHQTDNLQTVLSTTLHATTTLATGEVLLTMLEWEKLLPGEKQAQDMEY